MQLSQCPCARRKNSPSELVIPQFVRAAAAASPETSMRYANLYGKERKNDGGVQPCHRFPSKSNYREGTNPFYCFI